MDYDTYAAGEAELGWLNASVELNSAASIDAAAYVKALLSAYRSSFTGKSEIVHLKISITGDGKRYRGNLISTNATPSYVGDENIRLKSGRLLINARVGVDPDE